MASTFSSTEPFSSTDHNYKNCRKFWHKKVKVLSLLNPIVQKLLFLPSLLPLLLRRPRVPPYWGQGLLLAEQEHLLSGMRRIAMMASTPLTDVVVWIGDHRPADAQVPPPPHLSQGPSCLCCFWERSSIVPLLLLLLCIKNCRPIFYIVSSPLAHLPSHFFGSSGLPLWSLIFALS